MLSSFSHLVSQSSFQLASASFHYSYWSCFRNDLPLQMLGQHEYLKDWRCAQNLAEFECPRCIRELWGCEPCPDAPLNRTLTTGLREPNSAEACLMAALPFELAMFSFDRMYSYHFLYWTLALDSGMDCSMMPQGQAASKAACHHQSPPGACQSRHRFCQDSIWHFQWPLVLSRYRLPWCRLWGSPICWFVYQSNSVVVQPFQVPACLNVLNYLECLC